MKVNLTLVIALLLSPGANAGDVYVTRDAKGTLVYTDTPQTLPAERAGVRNSRTDPAEVQKRYEDQMKGYAQDNEATKTAATNGEGTENTRELTAEDRAKRCTDARQRYQSYMDAHRLFEQDPNGERIYLSSEEIDAARANAKQVMDEFCSDQ